MDPLLPGLDAAANIHPMLVHFPIAFWPVALLAWTAAELGGREDLRGVARWSVYLAAGSAVVAAASGLWATAQTGHDAPGHEFVHVHRNYMLAASGLGVVVAGVVYWARAAESRGLRRSLLAVVAVVNVVVVLGADRRNTEGVTCGCNSHSTASWARR